MAATEAGEYESKGEDEVGASDTPDLPRYVPVISGMDSGNICLDTKTGEVIWRRLEGDKTFTSAVRHNLEIDDMMMHEMRSLLPVESVGVPKLFPSPTQVKTSMCKECTYKPVSAYLRASRERRQWRTTKKRGKESNAKRRHKTRISQERDEKYEVQDRYKELTFSDCYDEYSGWSSEDCYGSDQSYYFSYYRTYYDTSSDDSYYS